MAKEQKRNMIGTEGFDWILLLKGAGIGFALAIALDIIKWLIIKIKDSR